MLIVAIVVFILAALLGLYLLSYILQNKNTPKALAMIHGSLAVIGLIILLVYSYFYSAPVLSLLLFIAAALGGFVMFYRDITGKSVPKWMAIGHGSLAAIALISLIMFTFI